MPFGEDLFNGVGARTESLNYSASGDEVKQKFTGYLKDDETELDFAEARMYENRHGRFTAVDPLLASGKSANPQTFNRYVYVGNNPLLLVDRNGLIWGKSNDGRVRWFAKKLGTGFSEFRPNNWEHIGANNKLVTLNPNKGTFRLSDVPIQPGPVENPIPSFLGGFRQSTYDAGTGTYKGFRNFGVGVINSSIDLIMNGTTNGMWGTVTAYYNPVELERSQFRSAAEARFGIGTELGIIGASLVVAGPFTGRPMSLSVVPKVESTALQTFFPANKGFICETSRQFLYAGERIDRFGGSAASRFFSPTGTPVSARSLPPETQNQGLRTFEVLKLFEVESGTVAPAFGNFGFGAQYRTPVPLQTLLERRFVREVSQ